jgi:uncharacterized protein
LQKLVRRPIIVPDPVASKGVAAVHCAQYKRIIYLCKAWVVIVAGARQWQSGFKLSSRRCDLLVLSTSLKGRSMHPDQPLSDKEFDELDSFLLSERCGDDCMTMDALHGYFTALVIGPEMVPVGEWLPRVWGEEAQDAPVFRDDREFDHIVGLMSRFMNEIAITFEVAPKEFEPLFIEHEWEGRRVLDGEPWAWGFWEGMQLRGEAWEPIWQSELAPLLQPIRLLGAEEIEEEEMKLVDTPLKCHRLTIEMEAAVPEIQRFWMENRKSGVATVRHETPKAGRNDLCSCGSGKKFKKCCGAATTLH